MSNVKRIVKIAKSKDSKISEYILVDNNIVPIPQKLLLTVDEASKYTNIGVNRIRDLMREKDCNFVLKRGTFSLIKREKFEKFLLDREVI